MKTKKEQTPKNSLLMLFAFLMLGSAIPDVLSMPIAVEGMHKGLGYPLYFIPFIGVAIDLCPLLFGYQLLQLLTHVGLINAKSKFALHIDELLCKHYVQAICCR